MKVGPNDFVKLYETIYLTFLTKVYNGIQPFKTKVEISPSMWDGRTNSHTYPALDYFSGHLTGNNHRFIHRVYKKARKTTKDFEFDSLSLYRMLRFLELSKVLEHGNELVSKVNDTDGFSEKAVEELYKQFLEAHEKTVTSKLDNKLGQVNNINETAAVDKLIKNFYGKLHKEECLSDAWELLTPKIKRERWRNNYERFAVGYTNTNRIRNMHIFNYTLTDDIIDCTLYYEDEIANYECGQLAAIKDLTLSQLDVFISNLNEFRDKIKKIRAKNLNDIKLRKLFEPMAAEYVWWTCGLEPKLLNKIFPSKKSETVLKLVKIVCKKTQDKWLIDWIEGTPAYSNQ